MTTNYRKARTLGLTLLVLLLVGCSGDSLTGSTFRVAETPQDLATLFSIQHSEGRVFVLNTQLRPVDDENPSRAHGHLQLKIREVSGVDPEPFYEVKWKGKVFNPAGETFTGGAIKGVRPNDDRPVLVLFDGARDTSQKINLDGQGRLSTAQAEAILAQPEAFQALLITTALPERALWGIFGGVDPEPF